MSLSYITRGNSSPQGKAKVYFVCHPDDLHLCSEIAEEILSQVNCAVFYCESITDPKTHMRDLAEMNLVVIPITTKLLTTPSDARDLEFPFAEAHHIPVLPLMQESGLDELFNRVMGNLQYLDKNARDDTAIS